MMPPRDVYGAAPFAMPRTAPGTVGQAGESGGGGGWSTFPGEAEQPGAFPFRKKDD